MNSLFVKFGAITALAIGLIAQNALPASAGEVENRVHFQQQRISAGVRDGQISHRQARRDERRVVRIQRERNRDLRRDGGRLTPHQYAKLNHQLNGNSNHIYDQRH